MRAREPDACGFVGRQGERVGWERFGSGDPALLFLCTTPIVQSQMWKGQVPWFARSHTVLTVDPRGNGRSDRPADPGRLADGGFVDDALAVLDANGIGRAVAVGLCSSSAVALLLAATHPKRVHAVVAINPGLDVADAHSHRAAPDRFHGPPADDVGWELENEHQWRDHWARFVDFFFTEMLPEPHSSKQHDDCTEWGGAVPVDTMVAMRSRPVEAHFRQAGAEEMCRRVRCPVLIINGDEDRCQPPERSRRVAELTGGELVVFEGAGHLPQARDPVRVNLEIAAFIRRACSR